MPNCVKRAQQTADNLNALHKLADCAQHVRQLCAVTHMNVVEVLAVLPGTPGSPQWCETTQQRCKIEDHVQFWASAYLTTAAE